MPVTFLKAWWHMNFSRVRAAAQISLVALSFLISCPAHAEEDAEELAACQREGDAAKRVELCTKLVDDKSEVEDIRAEALLNRGLAYASQNDDDKAIADYSSAIAL